MFALPEIGLLNTGSITPRTKPQSEQKHAKGTKLPRGQLVYIEQLWLRAAHSFVAHDHGLMEAWMEGSNFFELLTENCSSCPWRSSFTHSTNITSELPTYQTPLWVLGLHQGINKVLILLVLIWHQGSQELQKTIKWEWAR